jgi:hypothetical protein
MVAARIRFVRQTQVAAQHVDALLAAREDWAFIGGGGHRVHARDANRGVRITQLRRRRAESLREVRSLRVLLAPIQHHKRDRDHRDRDRRQRCFDDAATAARGGVLEEVAADPPRRQGGQSDT